MILETTHTDKKKDALINAAVGKPFGFFRAIKMNGIGSKRMIIDQVSPDMQHYLNATATLNYANLELRPLGLLIHINKGLRTFTWAIPYNEFTTLSQSETIIQAQGKFIQFRDNTTFKENKEFFKKLQIYKAAYTNT